MLASRYEVVIDGEIDRWCANEFAPARVDIADGRTTITTASIDQAGLHAIIERLARLRLTLLKVSCVDAP